MTSPTDLHADAPPHDLQAEQAVLGGMLHSRERIADVIELLKPGAHYRPAHTLIHQAILELFLAGEPADPITVTQVLHRTGDLARCGGPSYLHLLADHPMAVGDTGYYALIVREKAELRDLAERAARVRARALAAQGTADEILSEAQAELSGAFDGHAEDGLGLLGDGVTDTMDYLEDIAANKGKITGVPTGFADLDSLTHGLQPGQFIIVAGRPGAGKTTLGTDFIRAAAIKYKQPSVMFSLEMSRRELTMRILSAEAKVGFHLMKSGQMKDEDWTRLARRMQDVNEAPLWIDDSPNLDLQTIKAKARRLKEKSDLKLVVIDYLQLMKSSGTRHESRQTEVSEISRNLKLLGKELGLPVVALCQLNRGPEQRQDKKPAVSDLRESGSLEQDADMVILLHRDDMYNIESPRAGEVDMHVAKHRSGPQATITAAAQLHYSRFVDMAQS
jgi:replicative DNA helicase